MQVKLPRLSPCCNQRSETARWRTRPNPSLWTIPIAAVASDFNDPTCPNKLTYTANWNWDMALYMSNAEMEVFEGAKLTGEAAYSSRAGGANMNKFIDAEEKLRELVDELFPEA